MTKFAKIVIADLANRHRLENKYFLYWMLTSLSADVSILQYGTRILEENSPTRLLKTSSLIHESLGTTGLSILGGEPTEPYNIDAAIRLAKRFKEEFPNKDIWLWSGRLKEDIESLPHRKRIIRFN